MNEYSSWAEVKQRVRENQPGVSDDEWESRKQAARTATEVYAATHCVAAPSNDTASTYGVTGVGSLYQRSGQVFPSRAGMPM